MKIAFLGLGNMGYPMAGHLAEKFSDEYAIAVFNRSHEKALAWQAKHPGWALTLSEAVADADVILMCLGRDEDVLSIVESAAFYQRLKPGAIVIDHTTTSAQLSQHVCAFLQPYQVAFIDSPVSGGVDGANNASLSAMVGGDAATIDKVKPLLAAYCQQITHIGGVGSGQLCKMVNQICIAGVLSGLSEGLTFAKAQGIDANKVLAAISQGAAQSWQMQNRGQTMLERQFDFGFAIEWFIKDLGYCLAQAQATQTPLPATASTFEQFQAIAESAARLDTSALITYYDGLSHS